jgi:hypothetical protein
LPAHHHRPGAMDTPAFHYFGMAFGCVLVLGVMLGMVLLAGVFVEFIATPIVRHWFPLFGVYVPPPSPYAKTAAPTRAEAATIAKKYMADTRGPKPKKELWKQRGLDKIVIDEDLDPQELYVLVRDPLGKPEWFHSFVPFHATKTHHFTPLRHTAKRMSHHHASRWVQAMHAAGMHNVHIAHADHKPAHHHRSEPADSSAYDGRAVQVSSELIGR